MKTKYYFLLAVFVVAAALWKAGAPALPIVLGVACAWLWKFRKQKRAALR